MTFGDEIGQAAFVVLDGHDNVFVSDSSAQVIRVYSPAGKQVQTIGGPGSGPGQLSHPQGLALGGDGTVYVADGGNHRVQQFTATGTFIKAWGEQGTGPGKFDEPRMVAYDPDGFLVEQDTDGRAQRMRILEPHWPGYQWPVVPRPEPSATPGAGAEKPAP
jgi:DNA-binding beta-propeller fold protein YncE